MASEKTSQRIKSKDIDIYGDLGKDAKALTPASPSEPLFLQEYASVARKGIFALLIQARSVQEKIIHIVETGKAHTSTSLVTLREEENLPAQIGVMTVGSLLGYLVGVARGRFIKRSFYTSLGLLGSYTLCYPDHAKEMATEYGNVAYHFADGVMKEDLAEVVQTLKDAFTVPPSKDDGNTKS